MSSFTNDRLVQTPTFGEHRSQDENRDACSLHTLCRDCKEVDWSKVTVWDDTKRIQTDLLPEAYEGPTKILRIFRNPIRTQLLKSGCSVCRLVGHLSNSSTNDGLGGSSQSSDDLPEVYTIEATLPQYKTSEHEKSKCLRLAVRSSGAGSTDHTRFLLAHKLANCERAWVRKLLPSQVCFGFFRERLGTCFQDHDECRSTASTPTNLRLIDVQTKRVCSAIPGCQYIALSYVWGNNSTQTEEESFPLVVQDAMTVTEALNHRYLWVDRYCIDQNSSHKKSMIQQMDRVYGNAFVTIIAAFGNSSQDGLPGVSGPPRRQETLRLGETNLIELSSVGEEAVKQGRWATRGWTFQEGYLSQRRLIFSENEVLLLCNRELVKETQTGWDVDHYSVMRTNQRTRRGNMSRRVRNSFYWMIPTGGRGLILPKLRCIIVLHPIGSGRYERAGIVDLEANRIHTNECDHIIKFESGWNESEKILKDSSWETIRLV